jgi:hypothetical protein
MLVLFSAPKTINNIVYNQAYGEYLDNGDGTVNIGAMNITNQDIHIRMICDNAPQGDDILIL